MHTMSCISQKWDKPAERFIMGGDALTEGPHNFPSGEPICLWEGHQYRKMVDIKIH